MSPSDKVHCNPVLCFNAPIAQGTLGDLETIQKLTITMSNDINEVTCPECVYYHFHPEARELERKFRLAKLYG